METQGTGYPREHEDDGGNGAVAEPSGNGQGAGQVLTREALVQRAAEYRKTPTVKRVELPWVAPGAYAFVRGLSASERDAFEGSLTVYDPVHQRDRVSTDNVRAKFLVRVLCHENGTRYFADHEIDHIQHLDAKTADALYAAAKDLSGITQADVESMAKNSARARSGVSSSPLVSKNSDAFPTS